MKSRFKGLEGGVIEYCDKSNVFTDFTSPVSFCDDDGPSPQAVNDKKKNSSSRAKRKIFMAEFLMLKDAVVHGMRPKMNGISSRS